MTDNSDEFMNASAEEWSKEELPQEAADEFMKASAEEWSKPEEVIIDAEPIPETPKDRWGAAQETAENMDSERWGAEKLSSDAEPPFIKAEPVVAEKKKEFPWWVLLIILLVVLCLCQPMAFVIWIITLIF